MGFCLAIGIIEIVSAVLGFVFQLYDYATMIGFVITGVMVILFSIAGKQTYKNVKQINQLKKKNKALEQDIEFLSEKIGISMEQMHANKICVPKQKVKIPEDIANKKENKVVFAKDVETPQGLIVEGTIGTVIKKNGPIYTVVSSDGKTADCKTDDLGNYYED